MSMSIPMLPLLRERAPKLFAAVVSSFDKMPGSGRTVLESLLIVADVVIDKKVDVQFVFVILEGTAEERITQIRNWAKETNDGFIMPVGAVFLANHPTKPGAGYDEVLLVRPCTQALAPLIKFSVQALEDKISEFASETAGARLRTLLGIPSEADHLAIEIPTDAKT